MRVSPSRQVLDGAPARVLAFLIGATKSVPIRLALQQVGYGQDEHDYAWSRLMKLGAYGPANGGLGFDAKVAAAVRELDAYDDDNFPAIHDALARDYAEQAAFLFENLEVKQGVESVLACATLLERLDALESGKDRPKASRKADLAAIALLAKRGWNAEERARVAGLVTIARTVVVVEPISNEDRDKLLLELYRWHCDWSSQAKRVIKKKAHLITLGLASRKKAAKAAEEPKPTPAPQPGNGAEHAKPA